MKKRIIAKRINRKWQTPAETLFNKLSATHLIYLFVSKYQLQLPSVDDLRHYLRENISDEEIAVYKKQMSATE